MIKLKMCLIDRLSTKHYIASIFIFVDASCQFIIVLLFGDTLRSSCCAVIAQAGDQVGGITEKAGPRVDPACFFTIRFCSNGF